MKPEEGKEEEKKEGEEEVYSWAHFLYFKIFSLLLLICLIYTNSLFRRSLKVKQPLQGREPQHLQQRGRHRPPLLRVRLLLLLRSLLLSNHINYILYVHWSLKSKR